jgi:hypothetical protein
VIFVGIVGLLILSLAGLLAFGELRWGRGSEAAFARLKSGQEASKAGRFSTEMLAGLPAPVARYFRKVLRDGQPMVSRIRVTGG